MTAKTPEDVDRLFGEYINAGNLDDLVALYESGATLIPQPGQEAVGTEAIRGALEQLIAAKMQIKMNVVRAAGSGDITMLYNDWSGTLTGPDGAAVDLAGKALEVVRRQPDGTWKFVVDDPYARD